MRLVNDSIHIDRRSSAVERTYEEANNAFWPWRRGPLPPFGVAKCGGWLKGGVRGSLDISSAMACRYAVGNALGQRVPQVWVAVPQATDPRSTEDEDRSVGFQTAFVVREC